MEYEIQDNGCRNTLEEAFADAKVIAKRDGGSIVNVIETYGNALDVNEEFGRRYVAVYQFDENGEEA